MLHYPIYFNHVAKCAGTSLNELFSRGIPTSAVGVHPFVSLDEMYFVGGKKLDELRFVGGHVPHRFVSRRFSDWSMITVIRHPWERFLSYTKHFFRMFKQGEPFDEQRTEFIELILNQESEKALLQSRSWYPLMGSIAGCFLELSFEHCTESDLHHIGERAESVLNQYDLVLLTEHLNQEWTTLERYFQGSTLCPPTRLNSTASFGHDQAPIFSDELEATFKSQFPYDYDLYAAAQKVAPETIQRLTDAVENSTTIGHAPVPKVIASVDWKEPTRCGGLSDRLAAACMGYQGHIARRVEANVGVLELEIPKTSRARIEFVFWMSDIALRHQCRVSINGTEIECFIAERELIHPEDSHQFWTSAEIPQEALKEDVLRITFDRSAAAGLHEWWLLDIAVRPII